ncbi:MAG TPA: hypothetical protein VMH30_04185 [Verrucomicrobiae bacterium]|nr:hypothetical protein [Verrucomicrobiae bacterium]
MAKQLNRPARIGGASELSDESRRIESRKARLPVMKTSLQLLKQEISQRSPQATRPELNQSSNVSPALAARWNSSRCE